MADINDVDARSWEKIIHRMRKLERDVENVTKQYQQALTRSTGRHVYIGKATEEIAAVGETESAEPETEAASGKFQTQEITADGIVQGRGPEQSVFNLSSGAIATDDLLMVARDPFSGRLFGLPSNPNQYYYAYATSGIDPRNDSTKTFGVSTNLTLWKSKDDGTYEETEIETVIYNWSLTAVEDGAFMSVRKEPSGIYVVDNADCEAPPEEE